MKRAFLWVKSLLPNLWHTLVSMLRRTKPHISIDVDNDGHSDVTICISEKSLSSDDEEINFKED